MMPEFHRQLPAIYRNAQTIIAGGAISLAHVAANEHQKVLQCAPGAANFFSSTGKRCLLGAGG